MEGRELKRTTLAVSIMLIAAVLIARAQTADPRGEWNLVITARGKLEVELSIATEGDRLTARLVAPTGETLPATITLKGNDVRIDFDLKDADPAKPFHVTLTGTIVNERMSGSADFGASGSAQWTAVRTKAA